MSYVASYFATDCSILCYSHFILFYFILFYFIVTLFYFILLCFIFEIRLLHN